MAKIPLLNEVPLELLRDFFSSDERGLLITLKIKPNATKEKLTLSDAGELLLSVRGVALEGAANARVVEIVSELFRVPKSKIEIASGHKSRVKRLLFREQKLDQMLR